MILKRILLALLVAFPLILASAGTASAWSCNGGKVGTGYTGPDKYCCGSNSQGANPVATSINFQCAGKGNPIIDLLFAFIRFLSDGVGLVIIASLIVAGIQFTSSRGDPQATAKAIQRVQGNVTALLIFFFSYAILNYLLPGAIL